MDKLELDCAAIAVKLEESQKRADGYMDALREEGMNFGMAMPTPEEFVFALKGLMVVFARNARKDAEMELSRIQHTMKWTTENPTQAGYYFVYGRGINGLEINCVKVEIDTKGKVSFYFPVSGWSYEDDIEPDNTLYWCGPLEVPALPTITHASF